MNPYLGMNINPLLALMSQPSNKMMGMGQFGGLGAPGMRKPGFQMPMQIPRGGGLVSGPEGNMSPTVSPMETLNWPGSQVAGMTSELTNPGMNRYTPINGMAGQNPLFNMLRLMGLGGQSTGQGMNERNPYGTV